MTKRRASMDQQLSMLYTKSQSNDDIYCWCSVEIRNLWGWQFCIFCGSLCQRIRVIEYEMQAHCDSYLTSVKFTWWELWQTRSATLYHNHPSATTFSVGRKVKVIRKLEAHIASREAIHANFKKSPYISYLMTNNASVKVRCALNKILRKKPKMNEQNIGQNLVWQTSIGFKNFSIMILIVISRTLWMLSHVCFNLVEEIANLIPAYEFHRYSGTNLRRRSSSALLESSHTAFLIHFTFLPSSWSSISVYFGRANSWLPKKLLHFDTKSSK